jgi:hypothetical protein
MTNLLHKPKMFFMIVVISLSPFAQNLSACPPDCSAELADLIAKDAIADEKYEDMQDASDAYDDAVAEEAIAESNLSAAEGWHDAAVIAYLAALASGDPLFIIPAMAALSAAAYAFDVAMWQMSIAEANTSAAFDDYMAARTDYNEAYSDWIDAYDAYYECLAGE